MTSIATWKSQGRRWYVSGFWNWSCQGEERCSLTAKVNSSGRNHRDSTEFSQALRRHQRPQSWADEETSTYRHLSHRHSPHHRRGARLGRHRELWRWLKQQWLAEFLALSNGIPSDDTFRRVFEFINPEALHRCFVQWVETRVTQMGGEIIPIDGKTIRGSAWPQSRPISTACHQCLGQRPTAGISTAESGG